MNRNAAQYTATQIYIQSLPLVASENVGVLADGPPIRFSFKMSVLTRLKFNKVSFDVWKVGLTLSVSLMFVTGIRS